MLEERSFSTDNTGTPQPQRSDQYGRGLANQYYVRNIVTTASATPTRGQETTIMSGNSTNLLELTMVTAVNTSTNAQTIQIRSGTGGAVYDTILIAAAGVTTKQYSPILLQSEVGQAWTAANASGGEISDSPVTVLMTAIQNPVPGV